MKNLLLAAAIVVASPVLAEDTAVIISNHTYRYLEGEPSDFDASSVDFRFRAAGYSVKRVENASQSKLASVIDELANDIDDDDRLTVVLSGRFFASDGETFFAPTDLRSASPGAISSGAIALSPLMSVMADGPGKRVLFLGAENAFGRGEGPIKTGVQRDLEVPDNLMVVIGRPDAISRALIEQFLLSGKSVVAETVANKRLALRGTPDPDVRMVDPSGLPRIVIERDQIQIISREELAAWQRAERAGSRIGYKDYLKTYPEGRYAWLARQRIEEIDATRPRISPEEKEEMDLSLSVVERRILQRDLTDLGFDPNGVDGIFGPGTRSALRAWQSANGFARTGYFTEGSVSAIRGAAEEMRRAERLESRQRQLQEQREDRAYWQQTGANGSVAGLVAYLSEWPNGLFANQAKTRLSDLREEERRDLRQRESVAFSRSRQRDTVDGYRAFLQRFPEGRYANDARLRIEALERIAEARNDNREASAWQQALQRDSIDGYRLFLRVYPESNYRGDAEQRMRELRKGERRDKAERERKAWAQATERDTVDGYELFLNYYPESRYRQRAEARLARLREAHSEDTGQAREERAWQQALQRDSVEGFRLFLRYYGDGQFAQDARQRIRELESVNQSVEQDRIDEGAADTEAQLNLDQAARLLVEAQLLGASFNPGNVDGVFDRQTRRAIASYQEALNLTRTGYLDQQTFAALKAGRTSGQ